MKRQLENYLREMYGEIAALKQAKLKSAGVIATVDYPITATFRVTEVDYALFSSQALYITATSSDEESFLSQLLFTGSWDGRGYSFIKIYEQKGKTKWCLALTNPTSADYDYYYGPTYDQHNEFDVTINVIVRTTSTVNISTEWGENPYASVW